MKPERRHRTRSSRGLPSRRPANARQLAWAVLDDHKRTGRYVAQILDEYAQRERLANDERRLATEIVFEVVRRRATLNALLEPFIARPRHKIEGPLWTLLQIGACQLALLSGVPDHAAVAETVEAARRFGKARWTGFLNGVLRSVARCLTDALVEEPAADTFPIAGGRFRKCDREMFPDPTVEPVRYFAHAFSFPPWLAERWSRRMDFARVCRLGFWFNQPGPIYLRVNRLSDPSGRKNVTTVRDQVVSELTAAGIAAEPGPMPESIRVERLSQVESWPGFAQGRFSVQDLSAMRASLLLDPQPGETVLDLCAAPGTKTTHLAELMLNAGRILAVDAGAQRLERVRENCARLGINIVETLCVRADAGDVPPGPFDKILADVPCSNTGVLGKRPEARWRIEPNDLVELAAIQKRLLLAAAQRLKAGGRIVYSSCSIEPEENANVVAAVLAANGNLVLVAEAEHFPGEPADGGYQALLACRARDARTE